MAYKQLRDANWRIQYEGGWCLNAVQRAFNTPWSGSSAMDAWHNRTSFKHQGEPPMGITVPVFFDGMNGVPAGHVAVRLDDGMVASSTLDGVHPQMFIHPNIQHLIDTYRRAGYPDFHLVGWTEDLGGVRLVQEESLPANWRQTKVSNVNFRTEPNLSAPAKFNDYPAGSDIELAGFVHGENYSGSDIWFKTKVSGVYAWSGTMTDSSTNGLSDLTPAPTPTPTPEAPKPEPETPAPDTGRYIPDLDRFTFLVDISRYQNFGEAEFAKLKEAGVDGVIISAGTTGPTYGGSKVIVGDDVEPKSDMSNGEYEFGIAPTHQIQVDLARKAGLAVGHYFYVYAATDPIRQARVFCQADIKAEGEPLFIDAEEKDLTFSWAEAFANEVKRLTGKNMTYYDYTSNVVAKELTNRPLMIWLADYTNEPYKTNLSKDSSLDVIIHQYTSSGRIPGIDQDLDFNATPHDINYFKELGKIYTLAPEDKNEKIDDSIKPIPSEPEGGVKVEELPKEDIAPIDESVKEEPMNEMQKEIQTASVSAWKVDGTRENAVKSASLMVGRIATQVMVAGVISQGIMTLIQSALPSFYTMLPKNASEIGTLIVLIITVFSAQYGYKLDKFKWPF